MSKVPLTNLVNLQNETTAVNAINANNAAITAGFQNTLSRDGTSPNQMNASLDMNSQQILNLPSPSTLNSPARLIDVVTNPTIVVPGTGTSGHVVPFLDGNNTWSGSNTYSGNVILSKRPWLDVRAYGATGSGGIDNHDDTAGFAAALAAAASVKSDTGIGGGVVWVPAGVYSVPGGIVVPDNVSLIGEGKGCTIIQSWHTDVCTMTVNSRSYIEKMTIYGKGINGDPGTFGATFPALKVQGIGSVFRDLGISGGAQCIYIPVAGNDNYFQHVSCGNSYNTALVLNQGACWFVQCSFDNNPTGINETNVAPYPAWSPSTAYTTGQLVTLGTHLIQCQISGTSSLTSPTVKNFGVPMVDNTVTWLYNRENNYTGFLISTGAGENHCVLIDLSGNYSNSFAVDPGVGAVNNVTTISDSILASPTFINTGSYVTMRNCEIGNDITVAAAMNGSFIFSQNTFLGAHNLTMGSGVANFIISENNFSGGAVSTTGASDHYNIVNNIRVTVTDGASGSNKTVSGNH